MNFRHANKTLERMDQDPDFDGDPKIITDPRGDFTMAKRRPNHVAFPPGDHIREEIEYRGWTQGELARIMGRPVQVINEIINGHKAITARTARELEAALGPSAELWMNLETSYRLYKEGRADPEITVRARQSARRRSAKA